MSPSSRPAPPDREPSRARAAEPTINLAVVAGVLSSDPRRRDLPSGSEIISYEITSAGPDGRRLTVPVVWFDPTRPPSLSAGDEVVAVGPVRRRFFRAGGTTVSRTEVEARVVARVGTTRAGRALEEARTSLPDAGSFG